MPEAVNVHFKDVVWVADRHGCRRRNGVDRISELVRKLDEQAYTDSVRSDYEGSDPHLEGTRQSIGFLRSMRKAAT